MLANQCPLMDQPRYGCAVCRRPLNRFRDADGVLSYQHPQQIEPADHDPVPRPVEKIPGGVIASCDFCSTSDANAWVFKTSQVTVVATGPGGQFIHDYGTGWGACPACADQVTAGDLDRLHGHVLAVAGISRTDLAAAGTRQLLDAVLNTLKPGRTLLLDGRTGTRPPLPPAMLPKVRDRLAVLLGSPNILPALPEPAREEVVAGLMVSRLYALDADYTDMAVAAASSLHQVRVAALDVPAPFGLLTWEHPIDADATIAMSWTTDSGTIHVTAYRALATTIDGVQLQTLREQAGWLAPAARATLSPDQPIGADHPAAVLIATWLLIAHRLSEAVPVPVDRAIRNAYARTGRTAPDVRLVQLRPQYRPSPADGRTSGAPTHAGRRRPADYRWWVSPFVRHQAHGPGRSLRKPVLVLPFVNGPRGRPIKASTTVRLLSEPQPRPDTSPPTGSHYGTTP